MIGSQPSPRAIVRFAQTYKGIYLLAILVNFTLMARDQVAQWPLNQYLINGAVFWINLLAFPKGEFVRIHDRTSLVGGKNGNVLCGGVSDPDLRVRIQPDFRGRLVLRIQFHGALVQ